MSTTDGPTAQRQAPADYSVAAYATTCATCWRSRRRPGDATHEPDRWQRLLRSGRPASPDDTVVLASARAEAEARAKALAEAGTDAVIAELLDPVGSAPALAASGNGWSLFAVHAFG